MKIMVIGQTGMLGREVVKAVESMGHNLEETGWPVDITKMTELRGEPEVVINCAGWVPQRKPSPSPSEFMLVNGYGPWRIADLCDQIGARLIQVSTDCVFDGSGDGPHSEGDYSRPISNYGKSKLAGEIRREPHLTVRTSFVGFGKRGLIAELEQCAEKNERYRASCNLHWTGHTTRFVAEALVMLAEKDIHGLLHIPGETMTRLELVRSLSDSLNIGPNWTRAHDPKIDRRLASTRWENEDLPELPSFKWQLEWLRRSQS